MSALMAEGLDGHPVGASKAGIQSGKGTRRSIV